MKKLLCVLLVVLVLVPSFAFAAKLKGVTLDEFQSHLGQSAKKYFDYGKIPMVDAIYTNVENGERNTLNASVASATIYAATFPDSNVVEHACIYLPIDADDDTAGKYKLAFLFAVVDNKDAKKREKNAGGILYGLMDSASMDEEGNAYASVINDQYYTYAFTYGEHGSVYLHCHQKSDLKYLDLKKIAEETVIASSSYVQPTPAASAAEPTLTSGQWTCPEHIAAGEYKVLPIKSALVTVTRGESLVISEYLNADDGDEIGRLVLEAGDSIQITGGKLSFEPFK